MTSDGITQDDWDTTGILAAQIANTASSNDETTSEKLTQKLLYELNRLERKYGALPSILATRADYVEDINNRIHLLESAWSAAVQISDNANRTFIASSLAVLFIDELRDMPNGKRWLSRLEKSLKTSWDDHEYYEFRRLLKIVEKYYPKERIPAKAPYFIQEVCDELFSKTKDTH